MIPRSRYVAMAALLLAATAHAGALLVGPAPPKVMVAGGAPGTIATLGNAFADLAMGSISPETPPAATPVATPARAERPDVAPMTVPQVTDYARPIVPTPSLNTPAPKPLQPVLDIARAEPVEGRPTENAPRASLRPPERPDTSVRKKPVDPTPPKKSPQKVATAAGNAKMNARNGNVAGRAKATSTTSGRPTRSAKTQGNAAVSNYPGKVFARINRARRQNVSAKGTAIVAFAISGTGGLASSSIARSSGNAKLDAAALAQIRRAAPFPPPPSGARRSFTVKIRGR